eukprot:10184988-Prorocentrum_lima.AAC.1
MAQVKDQSIAARFFLALTLERYDVSQDMASCMQKHANMLEQAYKKLHGAVKGKDNAMLLKLFSAFDEKFS